MAGFLKKIFSFGKKEVVEERIDETTPLPPIKWDALEALKPATEQAVPEFLKHEEPRPEAEAAPPPPVEAEAPPAPLPAPVEEVEPAPIISPEPQIQPEPAPVEEPKPEPAPTVPPEPEIQTEPAPVEELRPPETAAEEPEPEEIPAAPVIAEPVPAPEPQEILEPEPQPPEIAPFQPEKQPEPEPVEMPAPPAEAPSTAPKSEAPPAEIPPPIRQPAPIEAKPVLAEIAPEPEAVPQPPPEPRPAPGKVTVSKKVEQKAEPQKAPGPAPKRSWFQRMKEGLARSSRELSGNIAGVFTKRKLDEDTLQDLEDVLIRADLGMETALRITDSLAASRYGKDVSETEVRAIMAAEVEKVLTHVAMPLELDLSHKPHVILVVGVNGTGKTTTIGKLAAKLTDGGLSVMLAAGDTFRAAAIEQLKIWGERTKSPVIASKLGADAAGLAYDAFEQAKQAGSDVLIIDTAGRLQNKTELMAELEKIVRVLGKLDPEAPHTVLQTVDATTGQNALNQVEIFRNVAGVNGLVMTKLDGTARGGILVAIAAKHKLPVYFIGVGEQVDDLEPFSASEFARAIAGVA
ncbi:signal recognition particle-docking protein FtsY [Mesorhizobium temperatum]|uniref:Signal recognition particle receptor FtsY n=1 Tax=Mesorhizobium temperatum TaxID=241416 RepID=A0A271LD99_9HYPH|nr:signal recognition particle-docking protein FtsY [Mesorhizobium temperatum]PAQ06092.1 signal recognition particle-docking protein FtsY [Mesorhizobium temperatum]